jgi:DNA-directed RNA polymerase subunit K/omega
VSSATRYAEVINKLKEDVVVHFPNQDNVATRAMEEIKASVFIKRDCPVHMY